ESMQHTRRALGLAVNLVKQGFGALAEPCEQQGIRDRSLGCDALFHVTQPPGEQGGALELGECRLTERESVSEVSKSAALTSVPHSWDEIEARSDESELRLGVRASAAEAAKGLAEVVDHGVVGVCEVHDALRRLHATLGVRESRLGHREDGNPLVPN